MKRPKITVTSVERSMEIRRQLNDIVNKLVRDYYDDKLSRRDLEGITSVLIQPNHRDFNPIKNMARDLACRAVGLIEQEELREKQRNA